MKKQALLSEKADNWMFTEGGELGEIQRNRGGKPGKKVPTKSPTLEIYTGGGKLGGAGGKVVGVPLSR